MFKGRFYILLPAVCFFLSICNCGGSGDNNVSPVISSPAASTSPAASPSPSPSPSPSSPASGYCGNWGHTGSNPWTVSSDINGTVSGSYNDVAACIKNTIDGDTVNIPGGNYTWSSGITVTQNITIQGAGYTNTKITRNGTAFTLSDTSARITGIGFILTSGEKQISITGGSGWRIDHCQFINNSGTSIISIDVSSVNLSSIPYGLIDNNDFVEGRIVTALASNATEARAIWATDHPFGSADPTGSHTIYIEDNTFYKTADNGGNVIDASAYTGAYVARYNTVTGRTQFQAHSFQDADNRGAKAWEIYGNSFTASPSTWTAMFIRGGTGLIFNNAISNYSYAVVFDNVRSFSSIAMAGQCNGTSSWDMNGLANGYPCRDQIGRGKDVTLWTDANPYPDQVSQPAYLWSNIKSGSNVPVYVHNNTGNWIQADRDYYEQKALFDGTSGVGCGKPATRPATCKPGASYWATEQSCTDMTGMVGANPSTPIKGTLYKCNASGQWETYYTPYTYPHPLRGVDVPKSTLVVTSAYGTVTSNPLGINCGSTCNTDYDSDTTVTLTASANSGYKFTGWSGACSGTGTCSVDMAEARFVTANYTKTILYSLNVNKINAFAGTVTSSDSVINCGSTCSANYESGKLVTLTATPLKNYRFAGWSGACSGTGTCTVNMTAAKSATATFYWKTYK